MLKLLAIVSSMLVSLGLAAIAPHEPPPEDGPPPHKQKGESKKGVEDLRRAYNLLRRLRVDDVAASRPEERIRDWTERASKFYRDGLKALDSGDDRTAHEYGAIAHDLARAADHARNASLFDHRDPGLPAPPDGSGPDEDDRTRRDLRRAYDRIREVERDEAGPDAEPFALASRDLYSAARRDVEAGRDERGGELARASEAMTHVVDHLQHLADAPDRPGRPEPKAKPAPPEPKAKRDRPEPKADRPGSDLPPSLDTR